MANNSFKIKNSLVLTPKDLSTLTSPEAGDLACDINDNNKIKRYDANAAAWVEVGSGGVGGVDIFFVQDFESASLSSFTQTGLVLSQTDPLKGKVSAVLNHQAAINQSFKQIIPVDRKFRGQSMVLRLDSKSDASQGNLVINIYDETNSANLVSSEQLQLSNDVNGRKTSVSFTIPETCASLSYTITALPESGKVSRIDDIICELSESALLETSVVTPNVTAWQGYTPTFQGFGSPTNVEFEWRQVGENVEIRGKFTAGVSTAVEARVGLPGGLTSASTSLIPSLQQVGAGNYGNTSPTTTAVLIEPSVTYLTFGVQSSVSAGIVKVNGNSILNTGNVFSFFASVPCSGLSATTTKTIPLTQSGLVANPDSSIRLDTANGYGSTATRIRRFSNLRESLGSDILYQDSATLGASFTIQTSGVYSISYSATSDSGATVAYITKNAAGAELSTDASTVAAFSPDKVLANGSNATSEDAVAAWTGYLNVGDIIRPHTNAAVNSARAARERFTITKESSLKQLNVSSDQKITIPTSELRFEGASARGTSPSNTIVKFDNIAKIRGDAFTVNNDPVLGTSIVMKKAGKLDVNTTIYRSGSTNNIYISKNQLILTGLPSQSETMSGTFHSGTNDQECVSWSGFVSINDVIRISTSQTPTADIRNNLNLSFQEQDISVSVTNTLPQFSESDSSVRVDTANGYGSTGTKIRRFSNVRDNIGTDITYNPNGDESVNGASFRVNSSGIYNISYTDQTSTATFMGISKNSSELTTSIGLINVINRLAIGTTDNVSGYPETVSWQGYLQAGDIIRAHTDGGASGAPVDRAQFTISKVGKPNVTGVDVTPFVNVPQSDVESIAYLGTGAQLLDVTAEVRFPTSISTTNKGIIAVQDDSGNTRTKFTALKRCTVNVSWSASISGAGNYANVYKNGSILQRSTALYISTGIAQVSWTGVLDVGDFLSFGSSSNVVSDANPAPVYITAEALSDQILTAPETFSTDTASLTYAGSGTYTLSTLANAPVGTYITFTYAANTNTRTQTTTRPTQTDADMNANGILLYARAYNAASTAAQPAAIAIQIGKGLKGKSLDLYKSAGKVTSGEFNFFTVGATQDFGALVKSYNEATGVLVIDSGLCSQGSVTAHQFLWNDNTAQTSGYLVINASKNPALTGLNVLQPRIATLSDVKASGTAGGAFTAGSYVARTLNTIVDPTGVVTSLASNAFTLPAGEYYIEASAPAYYVNAHKAKLRNITDSTDVLIGSSAFAINSGIGDTGVSSIAGTFSISGAKTFEIQHRCGVTRSPDGLGVSSWNGAFSFGDNEVYTIVKITRVR